MATLFPHRPVPNVLSSRTSRPSVPTVNAVPVLVSTSVKYAKEEPTAPRVQGNCHQDDQRSFHRVVPLILFVASTRLFLCYSRRGVLPASGKDTPSYR